MQWIGQTTGRVTVVSGTLLAVITLLGLVPWTLVAAEPCPVEKVVPAPQPAGQVQIEARFLEAPEGTSRNALAALTPAKRPYVLLPPDETTALLDKLQASKDVQVLSAPKIITLPGQSASVQIGRELPGSSDDADANFEGFSLEVVPKRKGQDLTLDIVASWRSRIPDTDQPVFCETRIDTRLVMPAGHTVVMAGSAHEKSREMVLLVSAKPLARTAAETAGNQPNAPVLKR
jgi:hypothetical protein